MSTSSLFLGNSAYSNDFSQVIERTLAIAELPLVQLQQQQLQTNDRGAAVTELQGRFETLRIALSDLSTSVGSANLEANFSSSGVATATVSEGAAAGSYSLEVTNLGSFTSYVAATGVASPTTEGFGAELTKTLLVDGVETTLTLSSNTLDALSNAINESSSGVTASVINVSSTSTPSYKVVLQGARLGAQAIALKDGDSSGVDLLESNALSVGANLQYKVNGVAVSAESRTVTIAPGTQITLNSTTSGPVSLVVKRSASQISDRILTVVAAYNAATGVLDKHRGQGSGALKGQSIIPTLSRVLRDLTSYTADFAGYGNFTDLGLSFDDQGVLSFNAGALSNLSNERLDALVAYLGSEDTEGFVSTALDAILVATTGTSGILALEKKSYTDQTKAEALQVEHMQGRLDLMESNLRERFAALDSAIAALQQQALYFNNLFESMRIAQQTYSK